MMGVETAEPQCETRDLEDRGVVCDGSSALAEATVEMLRELSRAQDPQKLVEIFRARSASISGGEYLLSLSRRGLDPPWYRITRHADWPVSFDPWAHQDALPLLRGGLLGDLIYGDEPRILADVSISPDDPGMPYLRGARSILCLPQYDGGVALNMVLRMSREPDYFNVRKLPDTMVISNLFGRATNGLVLARKLERVNADLDRELEGVGALQRDLLPQSLPKIEGLDIAASYVTATRAGGDYYDFFPLSHGRWGIVIADVSGHGAPAAVVVAILRTLLHTHNLDRLGAAAVLHFLNRELIGRCCLDKGTFVTAFYAVYDPGNRSLRYSCAGHAPPLLVDKDGIARELLDAQDLPLAIEPTTHYREADALLRPGSTVYLYTDGITEALDLDEEEFGRQRLRRTVTAPIGSATEGIQRVERALSEFVGGRYCQDDQTLLVLQQG